MINDSNWPRNSGCRLIKPAGEIQASHAAFPVRSCRQRLATVSSTSNSPVIFSIASAQLFLNPPASASSETCSIEDSNRGMVAAGLALILPSAQAAHRPVMQRVIDRLKPVHQSVHSLMVNSTVVAQPHRCLLANKWIGVVEP